MAPEFAKAAATTAVAQPITWARLNAESFPRAASGLLSGEMRFPTIIQFKQGQRAETVSGYTDADTLLKRLK